MSNEQQPQQPQKIEANTEILLNVVRDKNATLNNQNEVLQAKIIEQHNEIAALREDNEELKEKLQGIEDSEKSKPQ